MNLVWDVAAGERSDRRSSQSIWKTAPRGWKRWKGRGPAVLPKRCFMSRLLLLLLPLLMLLLLLLLRPHRYLCRHASYSYWYSYSCCFGSCAAAAADAAAATAENDGTYPCVPLFRQALPSFCFLCQGFTPFSMCTIHVPYWRFEACLSFRRSHSQD